MAFIKKNGLRIALLALALALALLTLLAPDYEDQITDLYGGHEDAVTVVGGQTLRMPLRVSNPLVEMSFIPNRVEAEEAFTLRATLMHKKQPVCEHTVTSDDLKNKTRHRILFDEPLKQKDFTLCLTLLGDGSITFAGQASQETAVLDNEPLSSVPAIRVVTKRKQFGFVPIYTALLVAVVALMPSGKKGAGKA